MPRGGTVSRSRPARRRRGRCSALLLGASAAQCLRQRRRGCGSQRAHPLQRPARADHRGAGGGLREEDGHHGQRPLRRRGRPRRPDRARRARTPRPTCSSPRTRRRCSTWPRRTCWPGRPVDPGPHAVQVQLARTGSGSASRPGSASWSTTPRCSSPASCRPRPCSWPSRSGRARSPWPVARPTSSPSSRPWPAPTARRRRCDWLEALKANAGSHIYPDNETIADEVNRGQVALGIVNQYYWYRERAEVGASNMHSAIAYFAPHDVGYVLDVSGAGILKSSTHQAEAQKFLAFLTSAQGQEIIAHSDSFEYPIASGVTTAQARDAVRPAAAEPHHHRRAGHRGRGDQAAPGGPAPVTRR